MRAYRGHALYWKAPTIQIYLRHDKWQFAKTKIEYLGLHPPWTSGDDPVKIAGVAEWPTPDNKKRFNLLGPQISTRLSRDSRTLLAHVRPYTKGLRRRGGSGEIGLRGLQTRVISAPIWYSRMRPALQSRSRQLRPLRRSSPSQQSPEDDKWHPVAFTPRASVWWNGTTRSIDRKSGSHPSSEDCAIS